MGGGVDDCGKGEIMMGVWAMGGYYCLVLPCSKVLSKRERQTCVSERLHLRS